jgi:hypothetical protein
MNYAEGKNRKMRRKMSVKAINIHAKLNLVQKIVIGFVLACLFIVALSSFTLVTKEDEPTEQHQFGTEIKVNEPFNPESHYAIKIFRYFEIFPYMRSYLYRFTPTDYKKICDSNTQQNPLSDKIVIDTDGEKEIVLSPKNNLPNFDAVRMVAPGLILMQARQNEPTGKNAMHKGS